MVKPGIHPPPPPTTPRLAPWDAVQELCNRLDRLIALLEAWAPTAPPPAPPGIPAPPAAPPEIPAPPELKPITDRLDLVTSKLDILISGMITNKLVFLTGQKDVTTAGTPEQVVEEDKEILVPDGYKATIIAKPGNGGTIYLGRTKADCATTDRFDGLSAGLAVSLKIDKLSKVWVDVEAGHSGDGISWIVEQD